MNERGPLGQSLKVMFTGHLYEFLLLHWTGKRTRAQSWQEIKDRNILRPHSSAKRNGEVYGLAYGSCCAPECLRGWRP